jgi:hypothetical protein
MAYEWHKHWYTHHIPRGPTVDRGASPGSPQNLHSVRRGPTSISSWARVRQAPKYPQWATNSECRPSGSSASHYRASPTYGLPQTSSGSLPCLPSYIRAQDLEKCTHVFLHQDITRRALELPYSSLYQVLSWRDKMLQLLMCRRPITVSATGSSQPTSSMGPTAETTSTHQSQQPCL